MGAELSRKFCLYCGDAVAKQKRGEHIIPAAIGGEATIRDVCTSCNNGVLSELDRELCSRSPLSLIAAEELKQYLHEAWDVDISAGNLLLEAERTGDGSMTVLPQMIFGEEVEVRWDAESILEFGRENFETLFISRLVLAFQAYLSGEKRRLLFEEIKRDSYLAHYQYPPRVFTRTPVAEFACRHESSVGSF